MTMPLCTNPVFPDLTSGTPLQLRLPHPDLANALVVGCSQIPTATLKNREESLHRRSGLIKTGIKKGINLEKAVLKGHMIIMVRSTKILPYVRNSYTILKYNSSFPMSPPLSFMKRTSHDVGLTLIPEHVHL